ncbi:MAG: hypothetical protein KGI73_00140 [Patescibacteria group bacterium]|nr:hypothetical protein [Patescibacteria group bacterium]
MEDDPTFSEENHLDMQEKALDEAIKEMREKRARKEIEEWELQKAEEWYGKEMQRIANERARLGKKPN